jgi:hypothetical protein
MVKINDYNTDEDFYRYLRGNQHEQIYFFGLRKIVFPWCPDGFVFLSQAIDFLGKEHYHEEWTGFEIITYPILESYKNQRIEELQRGLLEESTSGACAAVLFSIEQTQEFYQAQYRFVKIAQRLRTFLNSTLDSFILDSSDGKKYQISHDKWAADNIESLFSIASCNDDGDTHINYVEDFIACPHQGGPKKVKGSVIIDKAQLESILNQAKNDKKTPPQPTSPEINAETIIKFLETKGYVSHFVKIIIILLAEHTSDKGALLDLAKKTNFKELGFSDEEVVRIKEAMKNKASKFTKDIPGILWPRMPKN